MKAEGKGPRLRAKFFRDEFTNRDMIEIKIIGDPNTHVTKVDPSHIAKWPDEWRAYEQGKAEVEVVGTPLQEVPGITRELAMGLKLKGVRTAEELAALDNEAAKQLGPGLMTLAKVARLMLQAKELEAIKAVPKRGKAEAQMGA